MGESTEIRQDLRSICQAWVDVQRYTDSIREGGSNPRAAGEGGGSTSAMLPALPAAPHTPLRTTHLGTQAHRECGQRTAYQNALSSKSIQT